MKKTIFDLNEKEYNELQREVRGTYYGFFYYFTWLALLIGGVCLLLINFIIEVIDNSLSSSNYDVYLLGIIITLLFIMRLKWMDLVKKYYDEKNKK